MRRQVIFMLLSATIGVSSLANCNENSDSLTAKKIKNIYIAYIKAINYFVTDWDKAEAECAAIYDSFLTIHAKKFAIEASPDGYDFLSGGYYIDSNSLASLTVTKVLDRYNIYRISFVSYNYNIYKEVTKVNLEVTLKKEDGYDKIDKVEDAGSERIE